MREDKSLLTLMHISGLFAGFLVPLILWASQRDKIVDMDQHGKAAVNFQLSILLYIFISFFFFFFSAIVFFPFAFLMFFIYPCIFILAFIFPIISAVNVSNGKEPSYPMSIRFIV